MTDSVSPTAQDDAEKVPGTRAADSILASARAVQAVCDVIGVGGASDPRVEQLVRQTWGEESTLRGLPATIFSGPVDMLEAQAVGAASAGERVALFYGEPQPPSRFAGYPIVAYGRGDTFAGFSGDSFVLRARNAQQASDFALVAHAAAERLLVSGVVLTEHTEGVLDLQPVKAVPLSLAREFLGLPEDEVECTTDRERSRFGETRRRIPIGYPRITPAGPGASEVLETIDTAFAGFGRLTGRQYQLVESVGGSGAPVVIVAGQLIRSLSQAARSGRLPGTDLLFPAVLKPFPCGAIGDRLKGKKIAVVADAAGEHLTEDVAAALDRAIINGVFGAGAPVPHPDCAVLSADDRPEIRSVSSRPGIDLLADVADAGEVDVGGSADGSGPSPTRLAIRSRNAFDHALRLASWLTVAEESTIRLHGAPGDEYAEVVVGSAETADRAGKTIGSLVLPDGPGPFGREDLARLAEGARLWIAAGEGELPAVWAGQPPAVHEAFAAVEARLLALRNGYNGAPMPGSAAAERADEVGDGLPEVGAGEGRMASVSVEPTAVILAAAALYAGREAGLDRATVLSAIHAELGGDPEPRIVEVPMASLDEANVSIVAEEQGLRWSRVEDSAGSATLREAVRFYRTGRSHGLAPSAVAGELLPLHLHPYRSFSGERTDYPLLIAETPEGRKGYSLPELVDSEAERAGSGDEGESRRRLLFRIEARIRATIDSAQEGRLRLLWAEALSEVRSVQEVVEVSEEDLEWAEHLVDDLPGDGVLLPVGVGAARLAAAATLVRVSRMRQKALTAETDALALRLRETLGVDFSRSQEAIAPEHLQASVGTSYEEELDFEAFSHILEETDQGGRLPEEHRARLVGLLRILEDSGSVVAGVEDELTDVGRGLGRVRAVLNRFVRLVRAARAAELEVESRYDEEKHGALFERFSEGDLTDEEAAACSPVLVSLDGDTLTAQDCGAVLEALQTRLPLKILVTVTDGIGDLSRYSHLVGGAMAAGTVYVSQVAASDLAHMLQSLDEAVQAKGPALIAAHAGTRQEGALHPYLTAAAALESRAWPSFSYDPGRGDDWAARFEIEHNPSKDANWSDSPVEIRDGEHAESVLVPFTAVDYLAIARAETAQFLIVGRVDWEERMKPLHEFLDMPADQRSPWVPFVLAADESGVVWRRIPSRGVVAEAEKVLSRWRNMQELGGVRSSHAARAVDEERERLVAAHAAELDALRVAHDEELGKATSDLARQIVSNIAAGLLGVGGEAGLLAPLAATPSVRTVPATEPPRESEPETAEPAEPEVRVAEEEPLVLDEAYIETARCTTCNECTNINPRMFAYNENKQAFIKDISAGTFRELVEAAEKCPVRIIHVGKPRDPDEPNLDELIQRAEPFR